MIKTSGITAAVILIVTVCFAAQTSAAADRSGTKTVVAVGDSACEPNVPAIPTACRQQQVARRAALLKPDSIWFLGDNQYPYGTLDAFRRSFQPAWGRLRSKWRPAPGNHEYGTAAASGYFDFFGKAAGPDRRGYYSFNLGSWHVVSLNSNCDAVKQCTFNTPQNTWLREDLAANKQRCVAAFWHYPLYSSGEHGNIAFARPLYKELRKRRAEFVLAGHDHDYERFAPQNENGKRSQAGIREFVVGTGGKSLYPIGKATANSQFRLAQVFGVLELKLARGSYSWRYVKEDGTSVDRGKANCH